MTSTYVMRSAIQMLSIAASGRGETLEEIADALGEVRTEPVRLARSALAECVGAGTWRDARAEAAARLRALANQAERERWKRRAAKRRASCR